MGNRTCSFPGCDRRHCARGLCRAHYNQQREGLPLSSVSNARRESRPTSVVFYSRVEQVGDCWLWAGALDGTGYGRFREQPAHRWSYEFMRAEIPDGLFLDHLCRARSCVNPWHLEPVSNAVNILRGTSPTAVNDRKTHCVRGHEFTQENTYLYGPRGTWRLCIACQQQYARTA